MLCQCISVFAAKTILIPFIYTLHTPSSQYACVCVCELWMDTVSKEQLILPECVCVSLSHLITHLAVVAAG